MEIKVYDVMCPYCGTQAELITGEEVYPHRPDLYDKRFYACDGCKARVGCHPNTTKPLGRLADDMLRKAKMQAHTAFDPLWREGSMSRKDAYAWLAEAMGVPNEECHMGMFDVEQCHKVVILVSRRTPC